MHHPRRHEICAEHCKIQSAVFLSGLFGLYIMCVWICIIFEDKRMRVWSLYVYRMGCCYCQLELEGAFSCPECVHVPHDVHKSSSSKDATMILPEGLRYSKKKENPSLGCE
jgi:hypothetical protein